MKWLKHQVSEQKLLKMLTNMGKLIFGIGCGLITVLIRVFGSYPEGVSFAILLMNILVPYIDKATKLKALGGKR